MKTKTLTYLHNMKKIILTESEKNRILGMHKYAVQSEKKIVTEATLKDIQALLIQRGFLPATSASGKPSDDNTLGPKTLLALKNALSPSSQESSNTAATTSNTAATTSNTATTTPSTASTILPPPNTDGSDETFEAPVKYPWIGTDGKESLASIKTATDADPNLNNWLAELKKMSLDQLNKIKEDFRSFWRRIGQTGMDPLSNQPFLITKDQIDTAIKMVGNSKVTQ